MLFNKKFFKPIPMAVLAAALFIGGFSGGVFSSPITAKADVTARPTASPKPLASPKPSASPSPSSYILEDLGTYTVDLSKGSFYVPRDVLPNIYGAIAVNRGTSRIYGESFGDKTDVLGELLDFDKDKNFDVRLDYGPPTDIYSKTDTCKLTGTYTLKCTLDEIKQHAFPSSIYEAGSKFYTTVIFKFTDEAPTVNTDTNTTQDTAVTPAQDPAVQEAKETIDESIKIPSLNKPSKTKKSIKISWKKPSKKALKNIDGFEIQCSTDKSFATIAKQTTAKKNKTSVSIKKLTPGKKYYVRVRAYKNVNGEKVYSNWSKLKNAKLPKK